jgi:hypothetical protein
MWVKVVFTLKFYTWGESGFHLVFCRVKVGFTWVVKVVFTLNANVGESGFHPVG